MSGATRYLVVDIETTISATRVRDCHAPEFDGLDDRDVIQAYRDKLASERDGRDFPDPPWWDVRSIGVARVSAVGSIISASVIHRASDFWLGCTQHQYPTLVTYNGRRFDLPVLELESFRAGIAEPGWFKKGDPRNYEDPRNRYNRKAHIDLADLIGNTGAFRAGSLSTLCRSIGLPGKLDVSGADVADLDQETVDGYCLCDVLDTAFLLLRWLVLTGEIGNDLMKREAALPLIEGLADRYPQVGKYLEVFRARAIGRTAA